MNYDTEAIAAVLVAAVEQIDDITILRFKDARLKYELHLHAIAGTAMLAADPETPIQGCPMLEFSFRCSEIVVGVSSYDEHETALTFYEDECTQSGMRLLLTWVPEGYWYVWANSNTKPYT